jgi:hypothetical protein
MKRRLNQITTITITSSKNPGPNQKLKEKRRTMSKSLPV